MNKDLHALQKLLGVTIHNEALFLQAFTHSSTGEGVGSDNERLEFLGDAVLSLVVTEHFFIEFPNLKEGEMTEMKGLVVSRPELAKAASKMHLVQWLRLGKGVSGKQSIPRSILANAFEALIGAVYLDSGYAAAKEFCLTHLKSSIESADQGARNYKMLLQTYAQKHFAEVPKYRLVSRGGPDFSRAFQVQAVVNNQVFPPAWGKTKKEAEQWAAREALLRIPMQSDESAKRD